MKSLIGGIIGGAIVAVTVISIIISFPNQIEDFQNTVQKETMHICQKIVIENFEMYKENANLMSSGQIMSMSEEEERKYAENFEEKIKQLQQMGIDNDCIDMETMQPKGDWVTDEFLELVKSKLDEGF